MGDGKSVLAEEAVQVPVRVARLAKNDPAIGGAKSREECPNRSVPFIPDPTHRGAVKTAILKVSLLPISRGRGPPDNHGTIFAQISGRESAHGSDRYCTGIALAAPTAH